MGVGAAVEDVAPVGGVGIPARVAGSGTGKSGGGIGTVMLGNCCWCRDCCRRAASAIAWWDSSTVLDNIGGDIDASGGDSCGGNDGSWAAPGPDGVVPNSG